MLNNLWFVLFFKEIKIKWTIKLFYNKLIEKKKSARCFQGCLSHFFLIQKYEEEKRVLLLQDFSGKPNFSKSVSFYHTIFDLDFI